MKTFIVAVITIGMLATLPQAAEAQRGGDRGGVSRDSGGNDARGRGVDVDLGELFRGGDERRRSEQAPERSRPAGRRAPQGSFADDHPNAMERFGNATGADKMDFIQKYGDEFPRTVEWLKGKPNAVARMRNLSEEERRDAFRKYETNPPPFVFEDLRKRGIDPESLTRGARPQPTFEGDIRGERGDDNQNRREEFKQLKQRIRQAKPEDKRAAIQALKEKFPQAARKWKAMRGKLKDTPKGKRLDRLRSLAKDNPEIAKRFEKIKEQREAIMKLPEEERVEKIKEIRKSFANKREQRREKFLRRWEEASPERRKAFCETAMVQCEDGATAKRFCEFVTQKC